MSMECGLACVMIGSLAVYRLFIANEAAQGDS